ncbi:phage tail tape measure protein [Campylobacter sp. RM9344]|uniref:Phage tail tape measure protein n=1 Tax=Campylobacter californiensis TaxID=1032243 RepID=A0AAW3ZV14_9BACT|nr:MULTISPECIES: phage tail tape measure protein [unclassified Campylobacter]MBE2985464.1 phage tail tape measure protein [Campylobacter sp. RM6883]MBE2995983.1 phage tail tape measure protein [Campylobacter sp. RM6913]MBE3029268.1 phage tail tape measure protein [Campylobacter sp. RM9344]MBE3608469.1 phage tail tape measure protein [Campylobacter sp. RM9337]QCD50600.1 phage tail tape measure protein, TP901 family [Campylobacter sp. RM6914]
MDNTQVGIIIGLSTKGFEALSGNTKKLSEFANKLSMAGKNVTKLNEKIAKINGFKLKIDENLGNITNELSSWQSRLVTAASFAVPVKLAVDFETSMADVKKYVDFKSEDEVKILGEQIKSLSRELGVNANELAQISASGGQLGLKSDEIAGFTKLVSKMGVTFDMSGKDAGDAIALTMNNLKLGIDEIAVLGDKINYLDDKMSMVNARDIINVIGRTAGSGSILGLEGDKISALASSFLSLGKAPEVASTAMNSLFNKLANIDGQDEKFKEALKSMGMDANYLKVAMQRDASGGLDMFLNALAKVDKRAQMGVLTDMFGSQFADDMGSLVNAIDKYNEASSLINSEGAKGSMDGALKNKLATTKSGLERLSQSFISLGITIGEAFLPTLNLITSGLGKLTNGIIALTSKFPNATKVIFGFMGGVLAIVTLAPAIKILGWGLGIAWQQAKILGSAFGVLNEILKLKYLNTIKLNYAYLKVTASAKITAAATWANNAASKAYAATCGLLKTAVSVLVGAFKTLRSALITTGIGALVVALGLGANYIIENWDKVKAFFSNIWEGIKPYWQAITQFFSDLWQGLSDFLSGIFSPVVDAWNSLFGGFFDWIGEKFAWVSDMVSAIGNVIGKATSWTKDTLGIGDGKESNWHNPLSWFNDDTPGEKTPAFSDTFNTTSPNMAKSTVAMTTSGATINVNFSGDFNIATNNGKFDMSEFERQVIASVKRALKTDEMNAKNRSIIGQ